MTPSALHCFSQILDFPLGQPIYACVYLCVYMLCIYMCVYVYVGSTGGALPLVG